MSGLAEPTPQTLRFETATFSRQCLDEAHQFGLPPLRCCKLFPILGGRQIQAYLRPVPYPATLLSKTDGADCFGYAER